jgi:haloacetate dehalogenase
MALDHPDRIERLVVLNVVPTVDQFRRMADGRSLGYWPWFLLAQPAPFPEQLLAASAERFLRFVFDSWSEDASAIDEDAFAAYCDALTPAAAAAICGDYRASFWFDQEHERADLRAGRRIECPTLVVTGTAESQLADAGEVWRRWANDLRVQTLPGGHFMPEEAPSALAAALDDFLGSAGRRA